MPHSSAHHVTPLTTGRGAGAPPAAMALRPGRFLSCRLSRAAGTGTVNPDSGIIWGLVKVVRKWYTRDAMAHPCQGCPATAYHGHIACPVGASVLNKGRCRRVRRMDAGDAALALYRAWDARFRAAKEAEDRELLRFLRWHSNGGESRTAMVLAGLAPRAQVLTLGSPVVAASVRRATGGGRTDQEIAADHGSALAVADWERRHGPPASVDPPDAPATSASSGERGTRPHATARPSGRATRKRGLLPVTPKPAWQQSGTRVRPASATNR